MENKIIGIDLDKKNHQDLLLRFTDFIKNFSPLLDSVENYQQCISSIKLLDDSSATKLKAEIIEELSCTLTNMVPLFVKFSILEDKLEKLYID